MFIGLGLGLIFFLFTIKAYTIGLQHGKQLGNANVPTIELNPVQVVKRHVEVKKEKQENDRTMEGLENIMSYTGDPQTKEGE